MGKRDIEKEYIKALEDYAAAAKSLIESYETLIESYKRELGLYERLSTLDSCHVDNLERLVVLLSKAKDKYKLPTGVVDITLNLEGDMLRIFGERYATLACEHTLKTNDREVAAGLYMLECLLLVLVEAGVNIKVAEEEISRMLTSFYEAYAM